MAVPGKTDECWGALLTGVSERKFSSLATRLLVARLRRDVRRDPDTLTKAIDELHAFFITNPFAARDISAL